MGRFGNVLLVAGEPDYALTVKAGEVVRLWLTNTANTRVFNVTLPGARMKLVGGDSGRVEHEEFVSQVILAPSERAVIDVLFGQPGQLELQHRTPDRTYRLAAITVTGEQATPSLADQFEVLRERTGAGRRAAGAGRLAGCPAGQDAGPGRRDGRHHRARAGASRLRLPDAPRESPATNPAAAPNAA